ncbi:DNA binding protein [Ceratobasidium sp. 392]|nr:DNA binding protein [Ceratobasidium sp. 392]
MDKTVQLNQQTVTAAASSMLVKALFTTALGCLTWIRGLLNEGDFEEAYIGSKTLGVPLSSRCKVVMIERGSSTEANISSTALKRGYSMLSKNSISRVSFLLSIVTKKARTSGLVEAYTFNVSYHEIDGTNAHHPTLREAGNSVKAAIKKILATSLYLNDLPDRRFATFKVNYHGHTLPRYEPPYFVAGDVTRNFVFATPSIQEAPKRIQCDSSQSFLWGAKLTACNEGESKTCGHTVRVEIASVTDYISPQENNTGRTFHEVEIQERFATAMKTSLAQNCVDLSIRAP